jgi:hypothetical protein
MMACVSRSLLIGDDHDNDQQYAPGAAADRFLKKTHFSKADATARLLLVLPF